mgnify:FL=1
MTDRQLDLYNELVKQAFSQQLPQLGIGVYGATPPDFGKALDRLADLCRENGLCPECGFPLPERDCEAAND